VPGPERGADPLDDREDRLDQPLVADCRLDDMARALVLFDDRPGFVVHWIPNSTA
jgi:hypothetical protein